jgi:hypothetical protein
MPYSDPKYPVINPSPDVDDCLKSMRIRDFALALGITSASWSYGYIFGKPARFPTASTAATLGFTFCGMVILQDTRGRLMGYAENSREVKLYGCVKDNDKVNSNDDNEKKDIGTRRFPIAGNGLLSNPKPGKFNNYD